jgi:hypothetical protein
MAYEMPSSRSKGGVGRGVGGLPEWPYARLDVESVEEEARVEELEVEVDALEEDGWCEW